MKLLIHSQPSTVQPLKFGSGYVISSHTLLGMWFLIHDVIKVNPYLVKVATDIKPQQIIAKARTHYA